MPVLPHTRINNNSLTLIAGTAFGILVTVKIDNETIGEEEVKNYG